MTQRTYGEHRLRCRDAHPDMSHSEWFRWELAGSFADGLEKGMLVRMMVQDSRLTVDEEIARRQALEECNR